MSPSRSRPHAASTSASSPRSRAFAEAGVDVSAERLDREGRVEGEQLCPAAHRGRPDAHPRLDRVGADERVARIVALEVGADRQAGRVGRGHVLRGVYGDVDPPCEQGLLDLLDEHAALADLAERAGAVAVAGGRDRHERDLVAARADHLRRELGLRQREP